MAPRQRSDQALLSRRTRGKQTYRCRVCRGIHPLKRCQRFRKLSAEKRLRAVLTNKYCSNCLDHEHSQGNCRRFPTGVTTLCFPWQSLPAPSGVPLLGSARDGKIRQLAERSPRHRVHRFLFYGTVYTSCRQLWSSWIPGRPYRPVHPVHLSIADNQCRWREDLLGNDSVEGLWRDQVGGGPEDWPKRPHPHPDPTAPRNYRRQNLRISHLPISGSSCEDQERCNASGCMGAECFGNETGFMIRSPSRPCSLPVFQCFSPHSEPPQAAFSRSWPPTMSADVI